MACPSLRLPLQHRLALLAQHARAAVPRKTAVGQQALLPTLALLLLLRANRQRCTSSLLLRSGGAVVFGESEEIIGNRLPLLLRPLLRL